MFPEQKSNDQKSKPSGLATARLILAAVIIFSVCLIMVLGVAGYLGEKKEIVNREPIMSITPDLTITPTPTIMPDVSENIDNWKTYRNEEYGFEFKYPNTGTVRDCYNGNLFQLCLNFDGGSPVGAVSVRDKEFKLKYGRDESVINSSTVIEVAGQKTTLNLITTNPADRRPGYSGDLEYGTYFNKNGKYYYFNLPGRYSEDFVRQILSTFKFTEKSVNYKTQTLTDLMNQNLKFKSYMEEIIKVNPLMTVDNFSVSKIQNLDETKHSYYADYAPEDKNDPRWIFSPDGEKAVSIYGMFGEPDSSLDLYNRLGNKKTENLLFCGTPCSYLVVYWLNNKQFVFVESGEDYVKDEIKYVLNILFYDIENNIKIGYQSQLSDKNPVIPKNSEWRARLISVCRKINKNEASCAYLK